MTRWKPVGYRYPKNQEDWDEEFENYKVHLYMKSEVDQKYPEYLIANKGMTLEEFKKIFFVEYFHRYK